MTTPVLGEFVRGLSEAAFRSDVQLGSYHRPENLDLVKSYIFTSKAAKGKKSSAELLRLLAEAYMPGNVPNRFTIIANYGHGKSHFALMLANFFGKPSDAPETVAILDTLEHALEDQAEFGFFQSFKENGRRPFLVLTLRGDEPGDLRSKFFRSLDEARQWYPELQSVPLPFWFAEAEQFLDNISQDLRPRAEAFLGSHNLDLRLLSEQVRRREGDAQQVCRELHKHLYGTYPDFGAHASIRDAVAWATDNLCGPDKPVEKLLVVFDEFGAFVRDYSFGHTRGPGTPLQDLLNGIENQRGKAAFAALTQQDPDAIAQNALTGGLQGDDADSLLKELNRLPGSERYVLHSSLELVLDAYLKQSAGVWDELLTSNSAFARAVSEATEVAYRAFKQRYQEDLGWDFNRFKEVVTKGCFPLHPLTTALLSTLQLRSSEAAPRTVLGFVIRAIEDRSEEFVVRGGQPYWIWPTTLADYFKDGLDEKSYHDFLDAMQQAGGADASAEQKTILKAMLLQLAGQVQTINTGYETTIAQLSGLPRQVVDKTLRELSDSGVIRHDPDGRFYTFWPAGRGAHKVEELLQKKLRNKVLDRRVLDKVGELLNANGQMQPIPVNVPWGHSDDWHAAQVLLGSSDFEQAALLKLSAERLQWRLDGKQRPRALVAWLLAENEEQVETYRRRGASILDQTFGGSYAPLVVVRPRAPRPELTRLLLELYGLSQFEDMDIKDVGQDQYEDRRRRSLNRLSEMLADFRKTGEYEVTQTLRARVHTVPQKLDSVLPEILRTAYYQGPREFFTQYKLNQLKLRNAVANVANHLSDNTVDAPKAFGNDPVAGQIVDLFLRGKWRVVNAELRLREPDQGSPLYMGWKALDEHFEAGAAGTPTRSVLSELLNPPYGYDYNTLTLLFTAWYGYNRHELRLSCGGRLVSIGEVAKDHKKGLKQPRDFLADLNECSITRQDRSQLSRDVEGLIRRVDEETFSRSDALNGVRMLRNFLEDERSDPNLVPEVKSAASALEQAVEAADEYDRKAASLRGRAESKRKVSELVDLTLEISKLPRTSRVKPSEPGPDALRGMLSGKVRDVTEAACARYEQISDISEYGLHYRELQSERKVLSKVGFAPLVERVDRAVQTLKERKETLERGQQDAGTLGVLAAIPIKGPLTSLREHQLTIAKLKFRSSEAQQEARAKDEAIKSEVSQLETFARGLDEKLSTSTTPDEIRFLKEDILRRQSLFEGSEEQHVVDRALERCEVLGGFFAVLSRLRNALPKNPEEADEQIQNLRRLAREHEQILGPVQLRLVREAEETIRQNSAERTRQALTWLESCEQDLEQLNSSNSNGGKLEKLLERLAESPAFLPPEAQGRLDSCEREARQLADQDQSLQVELHFKRITDRRKQEECLERLQQLLREP